MGSIKRLAIVGTGQLARMLAEAAQPLNVEVAYLALENDSTESIDDMGTAVRLTQAPTPAACQEIYDALGKPDVITVEKESVPVELLTNLSKHCTVYPNPASIEAAQHRGKEKDQLTSLSIATPRYKVVNQVEALEAATQEVGFPIIAKTLEGGYDGKGQWMLNGPDDVKPLLNAFPATGIVLEEKVAFEREVSLIGARDEEGNCVFYPVTENEHAQGVLLTSVSPAVNISPDQQAVMETAMTRLMEFWNYVGVLTIEFFVTADAILVNEIAPRVHNSGHWSLQSGMVSQFENHIRAVSGHTLGSTATDTVHGMVNILGQYDLSRQDELSAFNGELYWYRKAPKAKRKLGHINVQDADRAELLKNVDAIRQHVYQGHPDFS